MYPSVVQFETLRMEREVELGSYGQREQLHNERWREGACTMAARRSPDELLRIPVELALLYGIPRTATVKTRAHSRLFVLTRQAFQSVVAPSFA
jgi:hypothetical protein